MKKKSSNKINNGNSNGAIPHNKKLIAWMSKSNYECDVIKYMQLNVKLKISNIKISLHLPRPLFFWIKFIKMAESYSKRLRRKLMTPKAQWFSYKCNGKRINCLLKIEPSTNFVHRLTPSNPCVTNLVKKKLEAIL